MRRLVAGISGCLAAAVQANAQLAAPQVRTPWADSTHITGVAQKVMPDAPTSPPIKTPDPITPPVPSTIQELLDRMNGAELYFRELWDGRSGWADLPSTLRVVVRSSGAEIQAHNQWQGSWYTLCTLAPWATECSVNAGAYVGAILSMSISSSNILVSNAYCQPGFYGNANATASYSWEDYSARRGAFSNQNRHQQPASNGYSGYFFQYGSFNSSCYYEMPG